MATTVDQIDGAKAGHTSINPYEGLKCLVAQSPEQLCEMINAIRRPIKIFSFVASGNRYIAYFSGDVKIKKSTRRNK